jgi:hypothetical protein
MLRASKEFELLLNVIGSDMTDNVNAPSISGTDIFSNSIVELPLANLT